MKRMIVAAVAVFIAPLLALAGIAAAYAGSQNPVTGSTAACAPASASGGQTTGSGPSLAASAARAAGFTGPDLVTAVAVAGAESSYDPLARNSIGASGLWQILQSAHPDLFARHDWRDPGDNAVMAYSAWLAAGRSWRPWTTWTSGAYLSHLDEARAAVATPPAAGAADVGPCASAGSQGSARAFPGGTGMVQDPSGTGGNVTREMAWAYAEVNRAFAWRWPIACWSPRPVSERSDHPLGKACDFTVGRIGTFPSQDQRAIGRQLAHWLQTNAAALGVRYIIWDGRIWSPARAGEGWRPYTGAGLYDPTTPTGGHYDHVHLSVTT